MSRGGAPGALRALLAASPEGPRQRVLQLPAVHDGLTARVAEDAGFAAVFVSGNGVAASLLGGPDLGLVTMSESVAAARRIAAAVDVPVVHDADTGYGSALNVVRAVRELEAAGVAAITLEDQTTPKRCGLLDSPPPVVEEEEYLGKVEAAVWGRSRDLVVVARTDALRSLGPRAALQRARRAVERGADAALVVGLRELDDVARAAEAVPAPLLVLVGEDGPLAGCTPRQLAGAGAAAAVHPGTVRYAVAGAARRALRALREDGTSAAVRDGMVTPAQWHALLGLEEAVRLEERFVRGSGGPAGPGG